MYEKLIAVSKSLTSRLLIRRFLLFAAVGASGVGVDMGVYSVLTRVFGLNLELAGAISPLVAIFTNFVLNDIITFRDQRTGGIGPWTGRLMRFYLFCLAGIGIKVATMALFNNNFSIPGELVNLFGIGAATLWNFFLNSRWTWNKESEGVEV